MRLDRPIGTWLLYWPCAWSVALAGVEGRWALFLWLALGAFAMRSAGCVYNDIVDRDLDAQVERTRLRPLASGRVSLRVGLGAGRRPVPDRPGRAAPAQPRTAQVVALASLALVAAYPFMKRITWWPQAWLGLVFSWGALVGWPAVTGALRAAGAAALARQHLLGDRLRHALRDPGHRGRRAGRREVERAARWATRRRWASPSATRSRCSAVGRGDLGGPAGLARAARAASGRAPSRLAGRCAPIPRTARARSRCSARTAQRAAAVPRLAGRRLVQRARRAAMLDPAAARDTAASLVERAPRPAPTPPTRSMSASGRSGVQVRLGELEDVSRSEGEEIGLRVFVGQRNGDASPRPTCPPTRSRRWSSARWRWRARRPRIPMPAWRPTSCCMRGEPPTSTSTMAATPIRPRFARTRARRRGCRARRPRRHQPAAAAPRLGRDLRARHQPRLRRRDALDRLQLLGQRRRRRRRGMQRDYALAQRAPSRRSRAPEEIGRRAGERAVARLNPMRPKPGRCRCCSIRASRQPARPFRRRDQRRGDRPQDQLPARTAGRQVFATA